MGIWNSVLEKVNVSDFLCSSAELAESGIDLDFENLDFAGNMALNGEELSFEPLDDELFDDTDGSAEEFNADGNEEDIIHDPYFNAASGVELAAPNEEIEAALSAGEDPFDYSADGFQDLAAANYYAPPDGAESFTLDDILDEIGNSASADDTDVSETGPVDTDIDTPPGYDYDPMSDITADTDLGSDDLDPSGF